MNSAVFDVYFYDESREWIYTTNGHAKAIEEFYDTDWRMMLEGQISVQYLALRNCMDDSFRERVQQKGLAGYYPAQQVLSIVSDGNHSAYFVVNLDVGSLAEELYKKYVTDERTLYLADGRGNILYVCGDSSEDPELKVIEGFQTAAGEDVWWNADGNLYYVRASGYEDIYCVEKISHRRLYEKVERYRGQIVVLIILVMLSTTVLCTFMAKRLYQPIGDLYQTMRKDSAAAMSSGDEIAAITRTVRELNRSQEDNAQEIARQRELRSRKCSAFC